MDFNSSTAAGIYGNRSVDPSWLSWCSQALSPAGKDVVDIGCGGGIYSLGFSLLGARSVIGVDRSEQYVGEAMRTSGGRNGLGFQVGTASNTCLADRCADIVFERALIHHLDNQERKSNACEAKRLLRRGGVLCVQDRTFEDVQAIQDDFWIRSTLFRAYPRLLEVERARRPSREGYTRLLLSAGFASVEEFAFPEIRRSYTSFDELESEILSRKGKSILFELTDEELRHYCELLRSESKGRRLVECDPWTIWLARLGE